LIDRLRQELQDRLEQILAEADRLRRAIAALDPRDNGGTSTEASPPARRRSRASAGQSRPAATRAAATRPAATRAKTTRTAPGANRRQILTALSAGQAMTAGEVAAATGLGRGTVSTTLSKLTKTGEVVKAERGYALPEAAGHAAEASPAPVDPTPVAAGETAPASTAEEPATDASAGSAADAAAGDADAAG
jgi:DNA-binding transcriptional ArsR family regulator